MARTKRQFSDVALGSVLQPQALGIGLFGYTGTGKTESAINLARGIQVGFVRSYAAMIILGALALIAVAVDGS